MAAQATSDIERRVHELESKIQVHETYPDGLGYPESWKGGRACTNCVIYRWTCDMKNPKKCSRCKLLVYCSRICQLEHYNKTHKSHCKYLAGIKVKEMRRRTVPGNFNPISTILTNACFTGA